MARYQWTLALIIVCLPILATVITAFRVRDLPKSVVDSATEHKLGPKYSIKTESAKNYEELKKAVREKQQLINQKTDELKSGFLFKIDSESGDEDDDDELDIFKSKSSDKTKDKSKLKNVDIAPEAKKIKSPIHDNDDDDNDDDDDDDVKKRKLKNEEDKRKLNLKLSRNRKNSYQR